MNKALIKDVIKKQCPQARKYELKKKSIIYTDVDGKKYVAKENKNNIIDTYNYLNSRGFNYLPKLKYIDTEGYVYEYEEDTIIPNEQKMSDLVKVMSLLHNKTVYYKKVSIDEVKEVYDSIDSSIKNTYNYYDDIVSMIEDEEYMSPSEYMLVRNCSAIFSCLTFCNKKLDEWYEIVSKKSKIREVLLHNNLDTSHLVNSKENMLISWDNAKRASPIYDFIKLYKNNYDKYDFNTLYKEYIGKFPLSKEESLLMFVILFIPYKITFNDSEMKNTINVSKLCNYLYTTDRLFMENETKDTEKQDHNVDKK